MVKQITITVPGDKSITHRAIMLGALAAGNTHIINPLLAEDCKATLKAIEQLGIKTKLHDHTLTIYGRGKLGLQASKLPIDCGNSGTTMRLLSGILVAQPFESKLIGDASLSLRPMDRITKPLAAMGANILSNNGLAPLVIKPCSQLKAIRHELTIPSAQLKSCLLFAGLYAEGETVIRQETQTRDHSEKMLQQFNYPITILKNKIFISNNAELIAATIEVPGDFSSAAFFIVAALLMPNVELTIKNVGINPTRTGLIDLLKLMGADIKIKNLTNTLEPTADLVIRSSKLVGITVPNNLIANAIDEFPIFFIAASQAFGVTTLSNAKELTLKESNRISAMAHGLTNIGIKCEYAEDSISITGGPIQKGTVDAKHDHRVAMAFAIASGIANQHIVLHNSAEINTSFPNFYKTCQTIFQSLP